MRWATLADLVRLERRIGQLARERQALWRYGGVRRLSAAQRARLAELDAWLDSLWRRKREVLAELRLSGALPREADDSAPVAWQLARAWVAPPDPALPQGDRWRQQEVCRTYAEVEVS